MITTPAAELTRLRFGLAAGAKAPLRIGLVACANSGSNTAAGVAHATGAASSSETSAQQTSLSES